MLSELIGDSTMHGTYLIHIKRIYSIKSFLTTTSYSKRFTQDCQIQIIHNKNNMGSVHFCFCILLRQANDIHNVRLS